MDRIRPPADNPSTRTRGVATTVPSTSVRRNLFQQPRTRRAALATTATQRVEVPESPGIVVRDRHGEIEFGDPPSPDLEDRGELPLDSRQESESMFYWWGCLNCLTMANKVTEERQKLAEAVRQHQINSSALPDQPEGKPCLTRTWLCMLIENRTT